MQTDASDLVLVRMMGNTSCNNFQMFSFYIMNEARNQYTSSLVDTIVNISRILDLQESIYKSSNKTHYRLLGFGVRLVVGFSNFGIAVFLEVQNNTILTIV